MAAGLASTAHSISKSSPSRTTSFLLFGEAATEVVSLFEIRVARLVLIELSTVMKVFIINCGYGRAQLSIWSPCPCVRARRDAAKRMEDLEKERERLFKSEKAVKTGFSRSACFNLEKNEFLYCFPIRRLNLRIIEDEEDPAACRT